MDQGRRELTDDELFLLQKAVNHGAGYGLRVTGGVFSDLIGPLREPEQRIATQLVADGFLLLVGDEARSDDRARQAVDAHRIRAARIRSVRIRPAEPAEGNSLTRYDDRPLPTSPMLWIAYDPSNSDHLKNREQFNGQKPAWGEPAEDFLAKQGVDVPQVGDSLNLRMGHRTVVERRLEAPEVDDTGRRVTNWYWTIIVR